MLDGDAGMADDPCVISHGNFPWCSGNRFENDCAVGAQYATSQNFGENVPTKKVGQPCLLAVRL
jgi:hypothetical protein